MRSLDEPRLLFLGVFLGVVIALAPARCAVDQAWCDGYAEGTGAWCMRAGGHCRCAVDDELVEVDQ